MLGIGNGGVRAKFGCLESEIEEFEPSLDAWNRNWRSSSQVPTLEIGNGRFRTKFECLDLNLRQRQKLMERVRLRLRLRLTVRIDKG